MANRDWYRKRKKAKQRECILLESEDRVTFKLTTDEPVNLDYVEQHAATVRVQAPVVKKEHLRERMEYWAHKESGMPDARRATPKAQLESYIGFRRDAIRQEVNRIRQACRRIEAEVLHVALAQELIQEFERKDSP